MRDEHREGAWPVDPMLTWKDICALAAHLPGVSESTYYGYPALKVNGKFIAGCKDGENLVLPMDRDSRDFLMKADPDVFHLTDHYRNSAAVLARLAALTPERLRGLLEDSWKAAAPATLVAEWTDAEDPHA